MAKKNSRSESKPFNTGNKYLNLVIFAAVVCAIAVGLAIFNVGQPIVGYTLIIITVCVAAMNLKAGNAVILGTLAGVVSIFCGFPESVFSGPMIYKVLLCILPKIAVAWLASILYSRLSRHLPNVLVAVMCIVLGLVVNACVCALILLIASVFKDISTGMDLHAVIRSIFRSLVDLGVSIKNVLIP